MKDPPAGDRAMFGATTVSPVDHLPKADQRGGTGALVCVVDDDESVRDSFRTLLELLGFAVETYASGQDILADERRHQASCFIVDQHMPGIDGLATLAALRGEKSDVLTILVTGRLDPEITARAGALKIGAVLEKPFSATRLLELLRWPWELAR
jgi:two-component system, chemotaxis family, CheB/CheR fusion protein